MFASSSLPGGRLRIVACCFASLQNFVKQHFPAYVEEEHGKKEFFISFVNLPSVLKLRELKTEKIGSLCSFSATVTRTSEVSSCGVWELNLWFIMRRI